MWFALILWALVCGGIAAALVWNLGRGHCETWIEALDEYLEEGHGIQH